ncbi:hypothetical protein V7146_22960 [Gottfriedia acidiceleris]|uniref:hypothetical protein n=1 Tax=Gottfriedia acidiceleris TaxID=371036 RepID=UPI002FFE329E
MIGTPLFVNGVYIIDESSFTKFIYREPPSLKYFNKGINLEMPSRKFEIFEGDLTPQKMIEFLNNPPQIEISKELYKQKENILDLFNISRHVKVNHTIHMGVDLKNLKDSDRTLIAKYY